MNKNEIDQLLSKFYRGETTLDEEQQLRNVLSDDSVDALLMKELEDVGNEIEVPTDLESNLSDMIDQWDAEEQQETKVAPSLWRRSSWWVAAACVALVATLGVWHLRSHNKKEVIEEKVPVMAENTQVSTSPIIEETAQVGTESEPLEMQPVPNIEEKPQPQAKSAAAFKNKVEHLAQAKVKPQSQPHVNTQVQPELSASDEEIAIAALEKFSTTLNKGMDQLDNANEKINDINNTIQQHLI